MRFASAPLALLLMMSTSGCEDEPAPKPSASATATASASAVKKAELPEVKAPTPLDLASLKKSLKCSGSAGSGPCPVLEKFVKCRAGWSPIAQSGDGRWIGIGSVVKKGAFVETPVVLRTRRVPTNDVAKGALGVKVAFDTIPDSAQDIVTAAGKAVRALDRGDVVKKGNRAITYLNERTDWPEAFAQKAEGNQVYVAAGAGTYMCPDSATQALHVVRLSERRDHPGDGMYATLYPVTW